jgi:hypothetical protein
MARATPCPTPTPWPAKGLPLIDALPHVAGSTLWAAWIDAQRASETAVAAQRATGHISRLSQLARLSHDQQRQLGVAHHAWRACVKAFMAAWRSGEIRVSGRPASTAGPHIDLPPNAVILGWHTHTARLRRAAGTVFLDLRVYSVPHTVNGTLAVRKAPDVAIFTGETSPEPPELSQESVNRPAAPPDPGPAPKRSRKRPAVYEGAQRTRARKVLKRLFPDGYPTVEELPSVDLLDQFTAESARHAKIQIWHALQVGHSSCCRSDGLIDRIDQVGPN